MKMLLEKHEKKIERLFYFVKTASFFGFRFESASGIHLDQSISYSCDIDTNMLPELFEEEQDKIFYISIWLNAHTKEKDQRFSLHITFGVSQSIITFELQDDVWIIGEKEGEEIFAQSKISFVNKLMQKENLSDQDIFDFFWKLANILFHSHKS